VAQAEAVAEAAAEEIVKGAEDAPSKLSEGEAEGGAEEDEKRTKTAKSKDGSKGGGPCEVGPGLSFPDCLLIAYRCTRTDSPHPPPWPGHSFLRLFAHSVPVYAYTLAASSGLVAHSPPLQLNCQPAQLSMVTEFVPDTTHLIPTWYLEVASVEMISRCVTGLAER